MRGLRFLVLRIDGDAGTVPAVVHDWLPFTAGAFHRNPSASPDVLHVLAEDGSGRPLQPWRVEVPPRTAVIIGYRRMEPVPWS